jgi:thiol-disulfide isomerase/thioredoxin
MNFRSLLFPAAACLLALPLTAEKALFTELVSPFPPSAEVLEAPDAETAWAPIPTMASMEGIMAAMTNSGATTEEERERAIFLHFLEVVSRATTFMQRFPEHPQRWRAVQMISSFPANHANEDGTPRRSFEGFTWDVAKFPRFREQLAQLEIAAATAPDAPPEVRLILEMRQPGGLITLTNAAQRAIPAGEPVDLPTIREEILRLAAKYPEPENLRTYVNILSHLRTLSEATKEEKLADYEALVASANPHVRTAAQLEIDKLTAFDEALELRFTAVDGEEIDLADYRGKVVLIDFWATWCGPCIAEIPNIKEVYAEYREKGFEIIGVALENARLAPGDTPEQAAAKHARAKKVLNDFTGRFEMTWPQYYDGKFWNNDISTRLGVASIPAMFLIDQEGRIVTTEARGHTLEVEVRRLLGLAPEKESEPETTAEG